MQSVLCRRNNMMGVLFHCFITSRCSWLLPNDLDCVPAKLNAYTWMSETQVEIKASNPEMHTSGWEWLISISRSPKVRKYPTLFTCIWPEWGQRPSPGSCYCCCVRWLMDQTTKKVSVVCWVTDVSLLPLGADRPAVARASNWPSGWQKGSFQQASIMSVWEPQRPDGSVRRTTLSSAEEAVRMWWCRGTGYRQSPLQLNQQWNTAK